MTIPAATWRQQHSGNGVTTSFTTGFPFLADGDVRVILTVDGIDTEWVLDTQFTLTGAHTSLPGTVEVIVSPSIDYTPQTGETLTILSNIDYTQPLDGDALTTLPVSSVVDALDRAWIAINQMNEQLSRAPLGDETGEGGFTVTSWTPIFAVASDGSRRVVQIVGWEGGTGDEPAGGYLGPDGIVATAAEGVDIRGPVGFSGAGTGDMLAMLNLSDVLSAATAFNNIKQDASATYKGVIEIATDAEAIAKSDTSRALVPSNLTSIGASTTFAGLVELATDAETVTGTDTARATTPKGVADAIAASVPPPFPTATAMLFCQTAAPTGWTKSVTYNDRLLRITSGIIGAGGSTAFSTWAGVTVAGGAASVTVSGTFTGTIDSASTYTGAGLTGGTELALTGGAVSGAISGSGTGSASVTINNNVQYLDMILATKDA